MKRFNPEKELSKIQSKNKVTFSNSSKFRGVFVPLLIIFCSCIVMIGATYSMKDTEEYIGYTIKVDIINGREDSYIKKVSGGSFMDTIYSDATFGGINCTKGNLEYDVENHVVYSENISEDTTCILSFMNDGTKNINLATLNVVNDNQGYSYYYKADSINNYFKLNGLLFRIVRINGDGSLRLILSDSIGQYSYGNYNTYADSDIVDVLNNWLNSNFKNDDDYIITTDFDVTKYYETPFYTDDLINFEGYNVAKVGLLSVRELTLINDKVNNSYLGDNMVLGNGFDLDFVWAYQNGEIVSLDSYTPMEVYPVINIKISNIKGQGTQNYPYEID